MLEGIGGFGEAAPRRGIQPLCREGEATAARLLTHLSDGLEQGDGDISADDGSSLEHALLLGWKSVDARRQHRLHRGRHLQARQGCRQMIGPRLANEDLRLRPASGRFPPGRRDCSSVRSLKRRLSASRLHSHLPAGDREGPARSCAATGRAAAGCNRPVAPAVLVLGAIAHQQEDAALAGCRSRGPETPGSRCRSSAGSPRSGGAAGPSLSPSQRSLRASRVRWRRWCGSRPATADPRQGLPGARRRRAAWPARLDSASGAGL